MSQRLDLAVMRIPSAFIGKVRTRVRAWMWIRKSCCSCRTRWTLIRGLLQRFRGFLISGEVQRGTYPIQIVFNPTTYPNFLHFLQMQPDITILPTEMTFSVSRDDGAFEWAGNNLFSVFCQPKRLLDPDMWRLLYDVLRFNASARRILKDDSVSDNMSVGEYLESEGYSDSFKDNYLIVSILACVKYSN